MIREGEDYTFPGFVEILQQRFGNWIGGARQVVVPSNVLVEALMNSAEPQQAGRDLVGGGASFVLPKESIEVVGIAEQRPFSDVEGL